MGSSTMASLNAAQASEFQPIGIDCNQYEPCNPNINSCRVNVQQFNTPASSSSGDYDWKKARVSSVQGLTDPEAHGYLFSDGCNKGISLPSFEPKPEALFLASSSMPVYGNAPMNPGFSEDTHMGIPGMPVPIAKPSSLEAHMLEAINRTDEIVDKSIERRLKRMIKNRESAARSRAKKQQYITKLEQRVKELEDAMKELEDENTQLKRDVEEMQSHFESIGHPRYQLRRTSTSTF